VLTWIAVTLTEGMGAGVGDVGRQVANAHTIFNLVNGLLFIGFTGLLARWVEKLVPDREAPEIPSSEPRFLDDYYLAEPEVALERVRVEAVDFLRSVESIYRDLCKAMLERDRPRLRQLDGSDDAIDERQEKFLRYLGRLSEKQLTRKQQQRLGSFVGIVNQIENLGDLLDHVMQGLAMDLAEMETQMSESTRSTLTDLIETVNETFGFAIHAMESQGQEDAAKVYDAEKRAKEKAREAKDTLGQRLGHRDDARLRIFRIEIDLTECQARIARMLAEVCREIR